MEGAKQMKKFVFFTGFLMGAIAFAQAPSTEGSRTPAEPPRQSTPAPTIKRSTAPNVLDFESDVIEGERKSPDLFLQLQVDTPNLDVLLYQRKDFNDFHELEKSRRPIYRKTSP
jgi:hypothetical protein